MSTLKNLFFRPTLTLITFLLLISCAQNTDGSGSKENKYIYPTDLNNEVSNNSDADTHTKDAEEDIEEDTYSIWTDPCVKCDWYFCSNLDVMWQKQICIDNCDTPPTVVYEGQCEEHLECNPAQKLLEANIPCTTEEGYPGIKDKICDKGQIKYTNCETLCSEEVCDNIDNDCDGEIDEGVKNACGECGEVPEEICDFIDNDCDGVVDNGVMNACGGCGKEPEEVCNGLDDDCDGQTDEGQLNACGKCGPLNEEICDGLDNDCNGLTDEDLIGECTTDCETNLEYCVNGNWICTAIQPQDEVCDGLDNDCDGTADEGLDCLCTIKDVGVLMPCQESPLVCGGGYKTCECVDEDCVDIELSECLAVCHWLPQTIPAGSTCDKYLGEIKPEECNNHDDNCNQLIDENLLAGCYTGPPETLLVGICLPGEVTCHQGNWGNYDDNGDFINKLCLGEVTPEPEDICNGTDTNCDGKIDEDKELEPTDILFIIDLSGSMTEEINAVTTALNQFAAYYSDSEVIRWGLVFTASQIQGGSWGEQVVLQTDLVDFQTFMGKFQSTGFVINGADEQNYDAIYLAIHNLLGSTSLPYPIADLAWSSDSWDSTVESKPPKEDWNLSWRDDAKHVIILFSDEEGQTYLTPAITENILVDMINAADDLALYVFSAPFIVDWTMTNNYQKLVDAGSGGKLYYLTTSAVEMYNNLLEILDETACGGK